MFEKQPYVCGYKLRVNTQCFQIKVVQLQNHKASTTLENASI